MEEVQVDEDYSVLTSEAQFLVAFVEREGDLGLMMEAIGELDNPAHRAIVIEGLRGLANLLEGMHDERTH
jgi:hypothetical protein